jgi:hypothetical protein
MTIFRSEHVMTKDETPKDIEPVPEVWQRIGNFVVGLVFVALVIVFGLMFMTGVFIWSLLI